MAFTQADLDAAIARLLSKGQHHSMETDNLSVSKTELRVDDLLKLQSQLSTDSSSTLSYKVQRIKPMAGGHD